MDAISYAVDLLRKGAVIGLPTETVYGLAADAGNATAVRRVFEVKRRPATHPLIVHLGDSAQVLDWASILPEPAQRLIDHFWPGPLTLILPVRPDVPGAITGGQDSIALRMPNHSVALDLLRQFGGAVVAPSANRFGQVSPTCAQHVRESLGQDVDYVLDGGPCRCGVESTIVSLLGKTPRILRPGALSPLELQAVLGESLVSDCLSTLSTRAPGSHASHYAPRTPLQLVPAERVLGQAATALNQGLRTGILQRCNSAFVRSPLAGLHLSCMPSTAALYARELYARLREIDRLGLDLLLIESVPDDTEWLAVQDRLFRAASKAKEHSTGTLSA